MTKEHIEKVIRNNRAGYAAHQLFKEFEAAQQPLVDALKDVAENDTYTGAERIYVAKQALAKVKEGAATLSHPHNQNAL